MGNDGSKEIFDTNNSVFNEAEQIRLRSVYTKIVKEDKSSNIFKKSFSVTELSAFVGDSLTKDVVTSLHSVMSSFSKTTPQPGAYFTGFVKAMAFVLKGDVSEKKEVFLNLILKKELSTLNNSVTKISVTDLRKFIENQSTLLVKVLEKRNEFKSWNFDLKGEENSRLAQLLFLNFLYKEKGATEIWESLDSEIDITQLDKWLSRDSLLSNALSMIINEALPICEDPNFLKIPTSDGAPWSKMISLLDLPSVLLINSGLPTKLRSTWHLLYSSCIHGESFSTLLGHILKKGPTIITVKDKNGFVFGGFSSVSWEIKPTFTGTESCFLYQLYPYLVAYDSTGYNSNYVYLCLHQHTLPNGLGFGGQMNSFSIWIDAEFDHGHSTTGCATYQSPQLSGSRQFKIDTVEVWRVGPEIEEEAPLGRGSILDSDVGAKALLTMVGKIGASDGLRKPEETS